MQMLVRDDILLSAVLLINFLLKDMLKIYSLDFFQTFWKSV